MSDSTHDWPCHRKVVTPTYHVILFLYLNESEKKVNAFTSFVSFWKWSSPQQQATAWNADWRGEMTQWCLWSVGCHASVLPCQCRVGHSCVVMGATHVYWVTCVITSALSHQHRMRSSYLFELCFFITVSNYNLNSQRQLTWRYCKPLTKLYLYAAACRLIERSLDQ